MDKRKKTLLQQLQALQTEAAALAVIAPSARTPVQQARLGAIIGVKDDLSDGEMAQVNAGIREIDRIEAQSANGYPEPMPAGHPGAVSREPEDERPRAQDFGKRTFRSVGEQLAAIAKATVNPYAPEREALLEIHKVHAAASGASEAVPQDGGFLIQKDFTVDLLSRGREASQLMPRCKRIVVSGNGLDAPVFDETSRATGSRFGGVQIYRNNEAESVTSAKPKFGKWKLDLEDLSGLAYASDNLLQDFAALGGIFSLAFESEFAWVLDNEILNGDGAGKMLGILQSPALVSVTKETGQASATIVWENIKKAWARLWAKSYPNAVWLYNQDCFPQLAALYQVVGVGGVPVWLPPGGAASSPYAQLMGRPMLPLEQCATLGTVGDLVLADFAEYLIIEKGGLQADQSIHVRFIQHETTFRWKTRNNGQPLWSTAKTPANGSNSLSPFVAIATRA